MRPLTPGVAKVDATGRCALMDQQKRSGTLQYPNAKPVDEPCLAWELAGDLMAGREGGQLEEQPVLREERPSLAAREGPPEVERARQHHELQRYFQRIDPTDVNDVMEQ